jgi:hypothetical protein
MSELAIRNDQQLDVPTGREPVTAQLVQWAQAANAAYQYAQVVCSTQAVPAGYRGKPQEGAAAILAGSEVGLSPMASLRAFDNIQGTPAPKAITLRAIVQGQGHDLEVVESDARHCVVEGRRKGSDRWQRLEWTIERATTAGYVAKNPKWKTDPTSMLVARATSEMSRWLDSAAIMGMPYSAEEIRDQATFGGVDQPTPRALTTAADILGETTDPEQPDIDKVIGQINAADSQQKLDEIKQFCRANGIGDQRVLDAWTARSGQLLTPVEKVEVAPAAVEVEAPPVVEQSAVGSGRASTVKQQQELAILAGELGMERDEKLAYLSDIVGRTVASSKELTNREAAQAIAKMQAFNAQQEPTA